MIQQPRERSPERKEFRVYVDGLGRFLTLAGTEKWSGFWAIGDTRGRPEKMKTELSYPLFPIRGALDLFCETGRSLSVYRFLQRPRLQAQRANVYPA